MLTIRLVSEGTAPDLQQPQQPPIAETVAWANSRKMPAQIPSPGDGFCRPTTYSESEVEINGA